MADIKENEEPAEDQVTDTDSDAQGTATKQARAGIFSNIRVGARIAMIVALPVVGMGWLGAQSIVRDFEELAEAEKIEALTTAGRYLSNAIHEQQIERGLTALYVASKGKKHGDRLQAQRLKTDEAVQAMKTGLVKIDASTVGEAVAQALNDAAEKDKGLVDHRKKVDTLTLKVPQATGLYSSNIKSKIYVVKSLTKATRNGEAIRRVGPYLAVMEAKEYAGQERAVAAGAIAGQDFDINRTMKYVGLIAKQDTEMEVFDHGASTDLRNARKTIMAGPDIEAFMKQRDMIKASVESGLFDELDAAVWFDAATKRIDLLRQLEVRAGDDLAHMSVELQEHATSDLTKIAVLVGVMLVGVGILATFVVRGIAGPVGRLTGITEKLAAGELETEINIQESKDEIGRLVTQVKVFKDNLIETRKLEKAQAEAEKQRLEAEHKAEEEKRLAEERAAEERRKSEEDAERKRKEDMLELADSFESGVGGIIEAVSAAATEMQSSSQAMSATAEQTNAQSTAAAAATEEASANVQTVAAAAEELSASIDEISRQVSKSSEVAQNAVDRAQSTNEKVQGLSVAAQKIGEVVELINDIASQTNLLALNATIEAARAGEAGKGFAVVATEVKSLADQTVKATDEIGGQITEIQAATSEAVDAIGSISEVISEISEISSSISAAVEEQGASTREISNNVQQAAAGTQEISSNMSGVTQAASETGSAASQVNSAAEELSTQAATLKNSVDGFLQTVRAA